MAIPNVSSLYKRIAQGSEGGLEFARIMNLLLVSESRIENWKIEPYSDASGDYKGADALVEKNENYFEGFQFKFFPSPLSSAHKAKIIESVKAAMERDANFRMLYIVTPEDLMKEDKQWMDTVKNQYERKVRLGVNLNARLTGIEHWGHIRIIELFLRHPHIGKKYYPELFTYDVDLFKLASVRIDREKFNCDFSFTNDSPSTYLLQKVELITLEVWSAISGLPRDRYLKSSGRLPFKVDMKYVVNTLSFSNPIIFNRNEAFRFEIQLIGFAKTCPGNCVKFKFRFHFNSEEGFFIESRPITIGL